MSIAIVRSEGLPVLVGSDDEDRARIAVLVEKVKKNLERVVKDPYSEDIAILQEYHVLLSGTKKIFSTLFLRVWYIICAEWKTRRLRQAKLNLNKLLPEQMVVMVHWCLEVSVVLPFMFYARSAQQYTEQLVLGYCYRSSKEPCWEQAYYYYLNARATHARQRLLSGILFRYSPWIVLQHIEASLKESEKWQGVSDESKRRYAAQACVFRKTHIGVFYLEIAKKMRAPRESLKFLAKQVLGEARELAEGFASQPEEAEKIRSMLTKLAA